MLPWVLVHRYPGCPLPIEVSIAQQFPGRNVHNAFGAMETTSSVVSDAKLIISTSKYLFARGSAIPSGHIVLCDLEMGSANELRTRASMGYTRAPHSLVMLPVHWSGWNHQLLQLAAITTGVVLSHVISSFHECFPELSRAI